MNKLLLFPIVAFLFLVSGLLTGCTKNKAANACDMKCPSAGACTEVYLSFSVTIKNQDGTGYQLDSCITLRTEDHQVLNIPKDHSSYNDSLNRVNGFYLVFSDGFRNLTDQCGREFHFIGYKNNVEVVNEKYIFSHDCCHMQYISGKREIIK